MIDLTARQQSNPMPVFFLKWYIAPPFSNFPQRNMHFYMSILFIHIRPLFVKNYFWGF